MGREWADRWLSLASFDEDTRAILLEGVDQLYTFVLGVKVCVKDADQSNSLPNILWNLGRSGIMDMTPKEEVEEEELEDHEEVEDEKDEVEALEKEKAGEEQNDIEVVQAKVVGPADAEEDEDVDMAQKEELEHEEKAANKEVQNEQKEAKDVLKDQEKAKAGEEPKVINVDLAKVLGPAEGEEDSDDDEDDEIEWEERRIPWQLWQEKMEKLGLYTKERERHVRIIVDPPIGHGGKKGDSRKYPFFKEERKAGKKLFLIGIFGGTINAWEHAERGLLKSHGTLQAALGDNAAGRKKYKVVTEYYGACKWVLKKLWKSWRGGVFNALCNHLGERLFEKKVKTGDVDVIMKIMTEPRLPKSIAHYGATCFEHNELENLRKVLRAVSGRMVTKIYDGGLCILPLIFDDKEWRRVPAIFERDDAIQRQ